MVAQIVKTLPTRQETWVQSLGRKDTLDKERREWLPTLLVFPEELHGQRSLVGYGPWGRKELDMCEQLTHSHPYMITGKSISLTTWTFVGKGCLCFLICCLGLSYFCFPNSNHIYVTVKDLNIKAPASYPGW